MTSKNPGCLSTSGLASAAITLLVVGVLAYLGGGRMFSPGALNAQAGGDLLQGVRFHAELEGRCAACHAPFWESGNLSSRCLDCHTSVAAELTASTGLHGAFAADRLALNCLNCHTEHHGPAGALTRLDPVGFPHQALGFALTGHNRLPGNRLFDCVDCHGGNLTDFNPQRCTECHGELDPAFTVSHVRTFGQGCLGCHDGLDTYGASFSHDQTAFPLEGLHAGLGCETCHAGDQDLAALRDTSQECYACHADDDAHDGEFGRICSVCHTPQGWPEATIDHDRTAFPLVGEHAFVDCQDCHTGGSYANTPQDCAACHALDDAHDGEFGTDCAACHSPQGWEQVSFDHELASFQLTGAHASVACTACHQEGVFQGTPNQCSACHAEPVYHQGLFETGCESCHTTQAWRPALFSLPHPFPTGHGLEGNTCQTCHPNVLQDYTCYACHEHDPGEIAEEHREEGIANFQQCVDCHPTGLKDEAED